MKSTETPPNSDIRSELIKQKSYLYNLQSLSEFNDAHADQFDLRGRTSFILITGILVSTFYFFFLTVQI